MARLPIITYRRDIDVRIVLGQSIFDLYQQIQNIIQRECPELTYFFAEPLTNAVRGEINWNTRAAGSIKAATNFSPEERTFALTKLKENATVITQLINKLEKSGRSNSASTLALRSMLITPDLNKSLFRVGEDIVLAQWGCYKFGTDAKSADLFEQIDRSPNNFNLGKSTVPTIDDAPELLPKTFASDTKFQPTSHQPEVTPLPPNTPISEQTVSTETIPLNVSENTNPFLWRWLILLILLLLFIFGLIWKLRQTHQLENEILLKAEITELWNKVDDKFKDCGQQPIPRENSGLRDSPTITNDEFRDRQSNNQINTDRKVNVSLAWNDQADLDLVVKQPDGEFVYYKPCDSATCGTLDVDANRCDPRYPCNSLSDRPLENVSWPNKMIPGRYEVFVHLYSTNRPRTDIKPVPYTVQVTENGKQKIYEGIFRPQDINCKIVCSSASQPITQFTVNP